MRNSVVAGTLVCMMLGQPAQQTASAQQNAAQQQAIPDAPRPQALPSLGPIAPGIGSPSTTPADTSPAQQNVPSSLPSAAAQKQAEEDAGKPPEVPAAGEGVKAFTLVVNTNFVEVPFTVKDNKGKDVFGLQPRDIRVYENGLRQQLALFTTDPFPLSVALVVDQSLDFRVMEQVNNSLAAAQEAFTAYDEVAVFTYNNGPKMVTDFTSGPSARLTQALVRSKAPGREVLAPMGGPLSQTNNINGFNVDDNTAPIHQHAGMEINAPREPHTLNDAILEAAKSLAKAKTGRRRVIYVVSDGKEYGSEAKYKDVLHYLQQNKIAVYGTLVGDSSLPILGRLDKIHLPLMMKDNQLHAYVLATGGDYDAEFRQRGIETSFAKIASQVRNQYTVGYYTHEPFIDGKYRKLEIRVAQPNLQIFAKDGYYPTANDTRPSVIRPQ